MIDVDTATEKILAAFAPLDVEELSLLEAAGRVPAADVLATENVPPFRNAAMDGYAVRSVDVAGASWSRPVRLPVAAVIAAGASDIPALSPGVAMRIMTGAPIPDGADAVVRFEETDESGLQGPAQPTIGFFRAPAPGDNVRETGEDIKRGTVVVRAGQELSPPDLGLLASLGYASAVVHRRPRVAILSTGDELAAPGDTLMPGAIRDSNSVVLAAMARAWGADVQTLGIVGDSADALSTRLRTARDADLVVTSGGVSHGAFDLVKDVLRRDGIVDIWQVGMRPGKPLAFGHLDGTPLLGLPGNPVAAAVSFIVFGRPAIRLMLGCKHFAHRLIDVIAGDSIENRGQRRHFVRARLERIHDSEPVARCVAPQGAGILSSMAAAEVLLIVPESVDSVPAGTRLKAIVLDWA